MSKEVKKYDHHLDSKTQCKYVENFSQIVKNELTNIHFKVNSPTAIILISDLIEDIETQITIPLLDFLKEEKEITSNEHLVKYFITVKKIVTLCQNELKNLKLPLDLYNELRVLQKIIELCERGKEYSEYAININIYKLKIPKSDFDTLESKLIKFNYHTVSDRFFDLSSNYLSFTSYNFLMPLLLLAPPIRIVQRLFNSMTESCSAHSDAIDRKWEQYGLACKFNLLPGYIVEKDKIDWTSPEMKVEEEFNPDGIKTLYIVDCQPLQTFIKKGTSFSLTDHGKGHTVLFETLHSAVEFVKINSNGKFYDSIGGWKIDGLRWTHQERSLFRRDGFFEQIEKSRLLPLELNKIIFAYCQAQEDIVVKTLSF